MKTITIVGIILIGLGAVGLIYGGISYTSTEHVIDMGAMHVQVDETKHIPLSPIAGSVAIVLGVVLMVVGRKRGGSGSSL